MYRRRILRTCKSITRGIERGGPCKSRLFWAQMALASLVAISGPKKVPPDFQGPPLPMALVKDVIRTEIIKITTSRGNNSYITFHDNTMSRYRPTVNDEPLSYCAFFANVMDKNL
jgi:hypothetical protein